MRQFLPFDKNTQIFKLGPMPGRYFYISEFEDAAFKEYPNLYFGVRWPDMLFIFKDKTMIWVNDLKELQEAGKNVFARYILKEETRKKLKRQWNKTVKSLLKVEEKIGDLFLEDLSDQDLYNLWQDFYKLIVDSWLPSIPCELSSYGSSDILLDELKNYVNDEKDLPSVLEILTAPEYLSFLQKEELDLSRTKDLEGHLQKYFWLKNSYNGVEKLSVDFFNRKKKELPKSLNKLIKERLAGAKTKKRRIIRKYKLPKKVLQITQALCEALEWQDERRKHSLIYTYYKELLLNEVSRRFNYKADVLRNCSSKEVMKILEKRGVHILIERRKNLFGFFMTPLEKELIGEDAQFCWEAYSR